MLRIKDMPPEERPVERLFLHGEKSLSNAELLAIILRSGTRKENVLDLSKKIFTKHDLPKLSRAGQTELTKNFGIGKVKSAQISACFELARRLASFSGKKNRKIRSAKDAARMFLPELSTLKKEHFKGVYLDSRMQVIREQTLFVGSLDSSVVHPREVFQAALAESAASVILLHNHPSGCEKPSNEDIEVTKQLKNAGDSLGIPILDHIIIGGKKFYSFKEQGYL